MDYIYSELDPSAIDLSNCLIYHNYEELPAPDETNYKRIAFIKSDYSSETKSDVMLICLKINDEYTWVNALDSGIDTEIIRELSDKVDELEETKADSSAVIELAEIIEDITTPLIVNVSKEDDSEYGFILTLDKTWNEINEAYMTGKNVLIKDWPEWVEGGEVYPSRTIYTLLGVGMNSPEEYVVYTRIGTFKIDSTNGYPIMPVDEELVPTTLTFNSQDVTEYENRYVVNIDKGDLLVITAENDYDDYYDADWEISAIEGSETDLLYAKYNNTLTVTTRPDITNEDLVRVSIRAKLKDIPSTWSKPAEIYFPQTN